MNLSSSTLRKAAELQEQIEKLQNELAVIMGGAGPVADHKQAENGASRVASSKPKEPTEAKTKSVAKAVPSRGRRSTSPTGPLAPAVVSVLKTKSSPMSVSEIFEGLMGNKYKFTSPEPKKNLFARIYRMKGVKQVGPGKFVAE